MAIGFMELILGVFVLGLFGLLGAVVITRFFRLFSALSRKTVTLNCPSCGAETPAHQGTCIACGRELV